MTTHRWAAGFGALPADGGTEFRIWAPSVEQMALQLDGAPPLAMSPEPDGFFSHRAACGPGTRYRFVLPDGTAVPDPASRAQDGDVHDASIVVDPAAYVWQHDEWQGRPWHEAVVYELHVGALGGFVGVTAALPRLRALGVTMVELMPLADFPGARNWGYDGVLPYAPDASYGSVDELKCLIDTAHGLGLGVMLDVVYNHFGPDGNFLHAYAERFFRDDIQTPWGASIDFRQRPVRDFFIGNALYWLMEYRFDGLRFDAVHAISEPDFLDEMAATIRRTAEPGRHIALVLEHEGNKASHLAADFDAQWTDDWHHCLHVLLTGESEGYYEDFQLPAAQLARCMAEGFAYQGEVSPHRGQPRGEPSAMLPTTAFVICLQNHDQIGNRAFGERLTAIASPPAMAAARTLLLLSPFIPLLFMGEEWGSTRPFLFFTSHNEDLAKLVREGRRAEFQHFAAFANEATRARIPDPNEFATFADSIPPSDEAEEAPFDVILRDTTDLLALRARAITPGIPGCRSTGSEVLGLKAVRAGWRLGNNAALTLLINLAPEAMAIAPLGGRVLHATPPEAGALIQDGWLTGNSCVALLEPEG
jgi:maltooligosyltrehalose trehalohydrolase